MYNLKKFIYLVGIDGSGKTTAANKLVAKLRSNGEKVHYLYARYFPIISTPFKLLSKILIYKKDTEYVAFEKYSQKKTNFSKKHPIIAKTYIFICIIDYILFSFLKIYYKYITAPIVVVDRYLVDFIITLTIAASLEASQSRRLYCIIQKIFPKPTNTFFIDVSPEIAFSRKNDIPSIKYLEERKLLYNQFNELCNFTIVDGTKTPDELTSYLYLILK